MTDAERLADLQRAAWGGDTDNVYVDRLALRQALALLDDILDAATSRPDRPTMHDPNECPWCRKQLDAAPEPGEASFQQRVDAWIQACFGAEIGADRIERNHRFFEEATEAIQANGMTRSECHQLVDYTFDRPVGELGQEIGGVLNTLAALCTASDVDMDEAGEAELRRVWGKVETIRAKQKAKPKHSPLPEGAPEPSEERVEAVVRELAPLMMDGNMRLGVDREIAERIIAALSAIGTGEGERLKLRVADLQAQVHDCLAEVTRLDERLAQADAVIDRIISEKAFGSGDSRARWLTESIARHAARSAKIRVIKS